MLPLDLYKGSGNTASVTVALALPFWMTGLVWHGTAARRLRR